MSATGEPPKVCQLIKGLGRGGAEGLLPQVIRSGADGCEHSVGYFLPWKDALVGDLAAAGVPVCCFPARSPAGMLLRVPAIARWLRREGADILHCHLPLAGVVGRLAAQLAGVPVVYTEHNLQERYHPWTRRANLATWRLQAAVVAVSGDVATSIGRHAHPGVPVRVVLNGIEPPPPPDPGAVARARAACGATDGAPLAGTVAVLRAQKRLDLWIEAAGAILDAVPEARFVIVGDGPLRGELEARAAAGRTAGRVHFAGLQEDVAPWLAAMDLYLMSSQFEGLPLALLEAMSAGLPVVATRVGGIGEVVDDGVSGRLVEFGDPDALGRTAVELLRDPGAGERLGERGRQEVAERFGVARMARELGAVYRDVLAGGAGSR